MLDVEEFSDVVVKPHTSFFATTMRVIMMYALVVT